MHHKLNKSQITVVINCIEDLNIESSPSSLFQIITNLIINSITHGYELETNGEISINISEDKNIITLKVIDLGLGIKEENLKKLFEPFFTTKRGQGGCGLGLNIVYNLVTQSLKGTIVCESKLGSGTTFTIHFPCKVVKIN